MSFATHALGLVAWGTVVHLEKETHQFIHPTTVVSLDDLSIQFKAATLG